MINKYLIGATLLLALTKCSNYKNVVHSNYSYKHYSSDVIQERVLHKEYYVAQQQLQKGNFKNAIKQLEALDNRYPFGPYSQQIQLDLIYAYYKNSDFVLLESAIDRFMRLNPTHLNIDYVIYMRGLTDMALDHNALQDFFAIDRSDRNPFYAVNAFKDFLHLLNNYPNSQYSSDAQKRLIFLKNRLAEYELSVAKFYNKRGAYVAVVNRVGDMFKNYPDTQAMRSALYLMENAYNKLELNLEAAYVRKIIKANLS